MTSLARVLGKRIKFIDTSLSGLLKNKEQILQLIDQNGCICLENINLNPYQQTEFTKGMWDQAVQLPKLLAFNNQDQNLKYVTRVGNILLDGTLKDSQKQAAYWHQDGDFWGAANKHLFNCLQTKQIPHIGGDTWVMDLVEGAKFIKTKRPEVWKQMEQLIGQLDLSQIQDFKIFGEVKMEIQTVTKHQLINKFQRWGYNEVLFLSVFKLIKKNTNDYFNGFSVSFLHDILQKQMGFYAHKWREGDMLIWDNLQTMHASSGSFQGRRLLTRTQGRRLAK